ncbi:alpha/beta fold hydrolase [Evansella halocellulosilytica]|uniref:alpha/beta fold hydrolase n=1 Tax=Evansella halocellulosilytica TaxID=2011013 RepID=UPI0015CD00D9|nr:alpha/beta hydrolase [Evansella halocellulosilytica]
MNRYTPAIEGKSSVSSLEKITLNDLEQWILIRGEDTSNPILLCLHGGPGNAQIGWAPKYQAALEKDFVVVNWDQRGAGLSYDENISEDSMKIANFVDDAYKLTTYLLDRFNQEKITVVGHSWGCIIGMHLVHQYPELFHRYIGVGQSVHLPRGERLSYEFTMDYAKRENVVEAIEELTKIGVPPYKKMMEGLSTQRKWLNKFGGVVAKDPDFFSKLGKTIRERPEYNEEDLNRLQIGNTFSLTTMWSEVLTVNLLEQVNEVDVPVNFLIGEHDYNTPRTLVEEYYDVIKAPFKQKFYIDDVAHNFPFEKPDLFAKTLKSIFKETSR